MKRASVISALAAAFIMVRCGNFLEVDPAVDVQVVVFDDWELVKTPYNFQVSPRAIWFTDSKTGFIAGLGGEIYKTTDAGTSWQKKSSGTTVGLFSMMFVDAQNGFAAGEAMNGCLDEDCNKGSLLLKTTNGGETWSKTFFKDFTRIENVYFFDGMNGLSIIHKTDLPNSKDYYMAKSLDGGATWELLDVDIESEDKFQVVDGIVFVSGENQMIFKSKDKGASWEVISTPLAASVDVRNIYFFNENVGLLDGVTAMYRTVNGGSTWEAITVPFTTLGIVHFDNESEGFNIEADFTYDAEDFPTFKKTEIYKTSNGGLTWSSTATSETFFVAKACFPAIDRGYGINSGDFFTIRPR